MGEQAAKWRAEEQASANSSAIEAFKRIRSPSESVPGGIARNVVSLRKYSSTLIEVRVVVDGLD